MAKKEMYHYTSCGLDYIWLKNGFTLKQTAHGEAVSIHQLEELHKVIGLHLINNEGYLSGMEIRYLRKELDMPQVQLATILGVSENTIRGWENDRQKISGPADRVLRLIYREHVEGNKKVRDMIERISQLNREARKARIEIEETDSGWRTAA